MSLQDNSAFCFDLWNIKEFYEFYRRSNQQVPWYQSYEFAPGIIFQGRYWTQDEIRHCQFPSLTGKTFVDVGCNIGAYCIYAKRSGAKRVVGLDQSNHWIEVARECARLIELDIEFCVFDINTEFILERFGVFDVVVANSIIHLVPEFDAGNIEDPVKLIHDLHAITGGCLVIEFHSALRPRHKSYGWNWWQLLTWNKIGRRMFFRQFCQSFLDQVDWRTVKYVGTGKPGRLLFQCWK